MSQLEILELEEIEVFDVLCGPVQPDLCCEMGFSLLSDAETNELNKLDNLSELLKHQGI